MRSIPSGFHCGLEALRPKARMAGTHNSRNPTYGPALSMRIGGRKMWVGLAAITLAAAIGFNVLALAIQDREH
jgi:hypothetical protein